MPLCYEQDFNVCHFECDPWDRMTPGAVLRRVQEIGTEQCVSLGVDEALYRRTGTVFLLVKLSLQMYGRMPAIEETIHMQTRAQGMRRAVYHRVTSLHTQSGEKLCEADSRWVLVDTAARRILRKPLAEFEPFFCETPTEEHPMDLPRPEALYHIDDLCATYSLCDRNGHVNNTRYADMMCDHLPLERLQKALPRQMLLHYHTEIALRQAFTLHGAPVGPDGYYFAASQGDGRDFEGYALF